MSSKSFSSFLVLFSVPFLVTVAGFQAQAAVSCKAAHLQSSAYRNTFEFIRDLGFASDNLVLSIQEKPGQLESKVLQDETFQVQKLAEAYFEAAGMQVEKRVKEAHIGAIKDDPDYNHYYAYFKLQGSRNGDEFSRQIYGVQKNPEFEGQQPMFIFDPLYSLNFPKSIGHFSTETKAIVFGPYALTTSVAGFSEILRHEIQHYFEAMKIAKGEMSLARVQLTNPGSAGKESYSDFLSVDEIETHVREWRTLRNSERQKAIDLKLEKLTTPEKLVNIQKTRTVVIPMFEKRFGRLIEDSLVTIEKLQALTEIKRWFFVYNEGGFAHVRFMVPETPYANAKIDIEKLVDKNATEDQIQEALLNTLVWSKKRILKVQEELRQQQNRDAADKENQSKK